MKKHKTTQTFLAQKREKRRLNQLFKKKKHRRRAIQHGTVFHTYTSVEKTLNILQENLPDNFRSNSSSKSENISIPNTFSIIEDTESALKKIYELVSYTTRQKPPAEINFDHSALQHFDIAAEQILGVVAIKFRNVISRAKGELILKGTLPNDAQANRFIRAVGIIKKLDVKTHFLHRVEEKKLKILQLFSTNRQLRLAEESVTENAARRLVEYVNECLNIEGLKLSKSGTRDLSTYTGELLDNASEHSGSEDWILAGFLDPTIEERRCEIAIINFGNSLSDTFLNLPDDHYTRQFVDPFVALHESSGLFQLHWTKENLLTVVALQGQVSSKNTNSEDTRGNGTIDLIQFFQEMYEGIGAKNYPPAKMAIVSGSTKILFDGTHKLSDNASGRPVIAFNTANDLNQPPDRNYVKTLNGVSFPGTIVSISFPLAGNVTQKEN